MVGKIYSMILGMGPRWEIHRIDMNDPNGRLTLHVRFVASPPSGCDRCGSAPLEMEVERQEWHHDRLFDRPTFIHALVPAWSCPQCSHTISPPLPWARGGSLFHRH